LMAVEIGTVWRERDTRFERYVRVEGNSSDGFVAIRRCRKDGTPEPGSRVTFANEKRFNGRSGGYVPFSLAETW
jgi:hypothetical protein